ncbi:MAG: hypothetical protein R8G60_08155 [Roseovarius pacificus]|nr:hypothetical protein [Roseovarius pacificus]
MALANWAAAMIRLRGIRASFPDGASIAGAFGQRIEPPHAPQMDFTA